MCYFIFGSSGILYFLCVSELIILILFEISNFLKCVYYLWIGAVTRFIYIIKVLILRLLARIC